MNMKEIPCKNCISLSICKASVREFEKTFGEKANFSLSCARISTCSLVKEYSINYFVPRDMVIKYIKSSRNKVYDFLYDEGE